MEDYTASHALSIKKDQRLTQKSQLSFVVWFTGLSASGKSTLANALDLTLFDRNYHTYLLDGDNIRQGLNQDLGFSDVDRTENIRRVGEVTNLFLDAGLIVLAAFISPIEKDRALVKSLIGEERFIEIYLDVPLSVCQDRDPKGLYKMSNNGEILNLTGIDSIYEIPEFSSVVINTDDKKVSECVEIILNYLIEEKFIKSN
jgi:adenylylsulfate kinase